MPGNNFEKDLALAITKQTEIVKQQVLLELMIELIREKILIHITKYLFQ